MPHAYLGAENIISRKCDVNWYVGHTDTEWKAYEIKNWWGKIMTLGLLALIITCCLGFSIYRVISWREYKICYARLAEEFSADPTYSSIGNAIVDRILSQTGPDPKRLEVLSTMSAIAPIVEHEKFTLTTGELKQMIF